jgi:hypothetical protein
VENFFIAIVSILIGVAATLLASRYYYRRSVDKELTPFMQLQSNVLSHIDEEVKSDLHIEYKGVKVENLQQLQFLIANTGERAVRDVIKPLRLELPKDSEIMDASILYVFPEGREVKLDTKKTGNILEFNFPLLNKDEFFIFKLLIKGEPQRKELKFRIVADDLPPELKIKRLTYNQIERESKDEKGEFELGLLIAGVVLLVLAFFSGILAHYIPSDALPKITNETFMWVNGLPIIGIASVLGYVLTGVFALLGIMATIGAVVGNFEFPKSKKFRLPNELAIGGYGIRSFTIEDSVVIEQASANKSMQPTADAAAD